MQVYRFGGFELRPGGRVLTCAGRAIPLGSRAYDLLCYLVEHRDRVVSKAELLDHGWPGLSVEEANLTVHVSALRKVLGAEALSTVPGRGYQFVMPVSDASMAQAESTPAPSVPRRQSIAVLPFASEGGDADRVLFADGLAEEIITTLSKVSGLMVVARATSFRYRDSHVDARHVGHELGVRYLLAGSVRRNAERLRIAAQLIDVETGTNAWAERYDRPLADFFTLQDEISLNIVTELQVQLTDGEQARLRRSSIHNMEAWSFWVRGLACYHRAVLSREGMTPALMAWQKAAALDPRSATIQAMLGMLYYLDARFGFWNGKASAVLKGGKHVAAALALDPENPDAHMVQGLLLLLQGRHEEAVAASRLSLAFAPNAADVAAFASFVFANAGLGNDAVAEIRRAIRLCPVFPPFYLGHMGLAYRVTGQAAEAIAAFKAYNGASPGRGVTDLAIIHQQQGDMPEARRWAKTLLDAFPTFSTSAWRETQFRSDSESLDADVASLRALGLPD